MTRPHNLRHVADGYGIIVEGESMVPVFEPGDTALVNPTVSAFRGGEGILYRIDDHGGEVRATLKRFVKWTDALWTLRQFNPAKDFTLKKQEWHTCHRVVGKYYR